MFASSSQFETSTFWLWKANLKFGLMSGHDPRRLICISSEATWRAKSFGNICASLSPFCHELLAKNGLWPHLTSGDLLETPDHQLHPDLHRWGEWPWSWRIGWFRLAYAKREAFSYFPICLDGEVTLTWPQVTKIKIVRHTFYRYWWPQAIP